MSIQAKTYTNKNGVKITKYYAVVYDPLLNKPVWSKGFKSQQQAKKEEAKMIVYFDENATEASRATFHDIAQSWLEHSLGVYANSTLEGYKYYLNKYILSNQIFYNLAMEDLSTEHLLAFINQLYISYSAETVNKVINILSNICNHAIVLRILDKNPTLSIKRKKVITKKIITWTPEQIQNFLNFTEVKSSVFYELLYLAFLTGMRPSEVCGLAENDLSINGVLTLHRAYDRYGKFSNMKNTKSRRSIQLNNDLFSLITKRIFKQKNDAKEASLKGLTYAENDFLFKKFDGTPINPNTLSKAFKKLLNSYNEQDSIRLPDTTLYDATRHSFGTYLVVEAQVPSSIVSSIMGNSERVLNERYVHISNDAQSKALGFYANQINNLEKNNNQETRCTEKSLG